MGKVGFYLNLWKFWETLKWLCRHEMVGNICVPRENLDSVLEKIQGYGLVASKSHRFPLMRQRRVHMVMVENIQYGIAQPVLSPISLAMLEGTTHLFFRRLSPLFLKMAVIAMFCREPTSV